MVPNPSFASQTVLYRGPRSQILPEGLRIFPKRGPGLKFLPQVSNHLETEGEVSDCLRRLARVSAIEFAITDSALSRPDG
jgi:hypothetical protein